MVFVAIPELSSGVCTHSHFIIASTVIPLAKKLKECGVFGVSSGEYLDYAQKNREEWVSKGEQVVAEMLEKFNSAEVFKDEGEYEGVLEC